MNTITIHATELDRLITEIKTHVSAELRSTRKPEIEEPICPKEAAKYMKIHVNTLWARIKTREIPPELIHRNGGGVYFFKSELHQYIKES